MPKNKSTSQQGEPATGNEGTHQPAPVTTQERDEFVTRLIGHHGTPTAALTKIAGEQLKFKRRAQTAEREVERLQKLVPAADAVVLTGDEAKAHKTLKDKSITLDKVPAMLDELSGLRTSVTTGTRATHLKDAAGTKYDLAVLTKLLGDIPIEFQNVNQMKEDKSGIETVKVPYVLIKGADGKDTKETLDSYAEREFAPFKEILMAKDGDGEGSSSNSLTETKDEPKMPRQAPSGGTPPKGKDADLLKVVDKSMSNFLTPSQRKKEAAGAK